MEEEARRIGAAGGKALAVPIGASTARGAFGYVHAVAEVRDQLGSDGEPPWIFTSSSSGGTLAGLILGCAIFDWRARLVAVSADEPAPVRHQGTLGATGPPDRVPDWRTAYGKLRRT